ncbi:hypothetical protein K440DRAFT_643379 [Wilcoxina mikolae CBS 423.85]|nr:hypothetical protein K440DRAFT_643379 [Wilcoxina mikolae CBS 423.85]
MYFENASEQCIPTYLEVMPGGNHNIILNHQFVFQHRVLSPMGESTQVHRLIRTAGQLGLNAIAFLQGRKKDTGLATARDPRSSDHQSQAMKEREKNVEKQSNASSSTTPAPAAQSSTQPVASAQAPPPATRQQGHRPSWWKRFFH